jgi:predicted transcriptional regulator
MDENIVKKELKVCPVEMRFMISGLKNDDHWAVFVYLLENQDNEIHLPDIITHFETNRKHIQRIINNLIRSGLIDQRIKYLKDLNNSNMYIYKVTGLGIAFYDAMFDVIVPKKKTE